ncbi:MAG: putative repeat protein (TIGR01451 family) [Cellvibrionaceae bacterium]|jgi:uncharacterized repeat protein (TIGR01451 family)
MKVIKIGLTLLTLFIAMWLIRPASRTLADPSVNSIVSLRRVVGGFNQPTAVTSTGIALDDRLFVTEKTGQIRVVSDDVVNAEPFLNLEGLVSLQSERGLLGLAFDPNYATNGYFYINYSDNRSATTGDTIIKRFSVSADPDIANSESGVTILEVEQDFNNHNGGWLAFDPDGQLVIGMGDGGSGGDPNNRAQSKDTLLGKMLRINVHGSGLSAENGCGRVRNYTIPADNPQPNGEDGWCSEIWSYGWRNPWRFSFDSATGDMWVGDVGQGAFEEIDFEPAATTTLLNYGWRCYEGNSIYNSGNCTIDPGQRVDPVTDYDRSLGTSVTGGYVYRGSGFPDMQGHYFYGDFVSGRLWSIDKDDSFAVSEIDNTPYNISSFGEGSDDELYLADYGGGAVYQMVSQFGAKVELSATYLAEVDGVIEYKLTMTNLGTDALTIVKVENNVPAGTTYLSGGTMSGGVVTLEMSDVGSSETVSWFARPDSVGTAENTMFSVTAQELSGTIPGRQGVNQTTIVVEELMKVYLPITVR